MVRYLITSGTSKTGLATILQLRALGAPAEDIFAGTRDPVRNEKQLHGIGAGHVALFDQNDDSSIEKALVGIDRVCITIGGTWQFKDIYSRIERLASKPGSSVSALICIGSLLGQEFPSATDFALAEETILASKVPHAVSVAPNWFFENWTQPESFPQLEQGTVYGACADGKVAYIAVEDIGRVLATVLFEPSKYNRQRLVISGSEALTEPEIVSIIGKVALGKPEGIKYIHQTKEEYCDMLSKAGMPTEFVGLMYGLEDLKQRGFGAEVTTTVKDVTGRAALTTTQWAEKLAKQFQQPKKQ